MTRVTPQAALQSVLHSSLDRPAGRRGVGVQLRRGVALPPGTRSVARRSRWGYPFVLPATSLKNRFRYDLRRHDQPG